MKRLITLTCLAFLFNAQVNAHVGLISPVGGENYEVGENVLIEWEVLIEHNSINWDLYYSTNNGTTWVAIAEDIDIETLEYNWTTPEVETATALVKIVQDNEGTDYDDASNTFSIGIPTNIKYELSKNEITLYPNPVSDVSVLTFNNKENKAHTLVIYNILGLEVKRIGDIRSSQVQTNREGLINGLYFYTLENNMALLASSSFIVD